MQVQDSFSAKVMLFGEYSILLGSPALSVPFNHFSAGLQIPFGRAEETLNQYPGSNRMLREYYDRSLSKSVEFSEILDLQHLLGELDSGLYLRSTIPSKYGVGSSGALCAALYSRYAYKPLCRGGLVEKKEMAELRKIFIRMESWFHGKSSGLDPLVIYLRHPLIINQGGVISLAAIAGNFMKDNEKIFLLDTGQSTGTATLVPSFLEHYSAQGDKAEAGKKLFKLNHLCISHFCGHKVADFWETLKLLSDFQFHNLSAMIPDHMRVFWSEGLKSGLFLLKLCGSGGGGFLTGFTTDYEKTLDYFRNLNIPVIPVDFDPGYRVNIPHPPGVGQTDG